MPSLVLSLALLLLVLLTLLALSNRELIALTFLGVSTVALPLSVWIAGAIAVGFLLGLWILLLFRFGTTGLSPGSGRGVPFRNQRRANYGPEDFAVVDDRIGGGDRATEEGYGDRRDEDTGYSNGRYGDSRYSDGRYDDIYGRQGDGSAGYDQEGYDRMDDDRTGYDSASRPADYRPEDYRSEDYRDRAKPQDSFSAASGYAIGRNDAGQDVIEQPAQASARSEDAAAGQSRSADTESTTQAASAADPAVPADWDDPYREDWTEAELIAEPVLRNETAAPKLKRWFTARSQPQSDANQPQQRLDQSAEATPLAQPQGEAADWQTPDNRRQAPSSNVYDADYRVVQPPTGATPQESRPASGPRPSSDSQEQSQEGRDRTQPKNSEWDIESDLDW